MYQLVYEICPSYLHQSLVGSAANGIGDLDVLQGIDAAKCATNIVSAAADAAVDELEDSSEENDEGQ